MSWLVGDVSGLDLHEAHGGHGLISAGLEDIRAQNRRLEALLSTEQDAHRQSKQLLEDTRKGEQGCAYRVSLDVRETTTWHNKWH